MQMREQVKRAENRRSSPAFLLRVCLRALSGFAVAFGLRADCPRWALRVSVVNNPGPAGAAAPREEAGAGKGEQRQRCGLGGRGGDDLERAGPDVGGGVGPGGQTGGVQERDGRQDGGRVGGD
jgi:hypothetical protein